MTARECALAALEGRPCERMPVVAPYLNLFTMDHFAELTGLPQWRVHEWLNGTPRQYVERLAAMREQAPFDLLFPHGAPPGAWRERQTFVLRGGIPHRLDGASGALTSLATRSGMTYDDAPNHTRHLWDEADIEATVRPTPADELLAQGYGDYIRATAEAFGGECLVVGGGIVGAVWSCVCHLGFTQTLEMLAEEPGFLDRLIAALLAQAREQVAYYARCGSDIVFVDESGATGDLISPAHYERFGLPFTRAVVEEIHRRGMKAIVYYFGAAMDRLAQIAETRADAVLVECSMKGYTNDIDRIARAIGDRVSLFGNLDPVWTLERGPESLLAREVDRQVEAGRGARGFLLSTGSPITPGVPLARVRRFIELGRERATR